MRVLALALLALGAVLDAAAKTTKAPTAQVTFGATTKPPSCSPNSTEAQLCASSPAVLTHTVRTYATLAAR